MTDIVTRLRNHGPVVGSKIPRIAEMMKATCPEDMLVVLPQKVLDEAADEIERLRGIIYRNCDWRKAAILSSDEDAAMIRKICDADEDPCP